MKQLSYYKYPQPHQIPTPGPDEEVVLIEQPGYYLIPKPAPQRKAKPRVLGPRKPTKSRKKRSAKPKQQAQKISVIDHFILYLLAFAIFCIALALVFD